MGRRRVGVLVFDGVKLLDVAGPSEVFSEATRFGADYELLLCSPDGRDVASSTGMRVPVDATAHDAGRLDTVLVAGGTFSPRILSARSWRERHRNSRDTRGGSPPSAPARSCWRRRDC